MRWSYPVSTLRYRSVASVALCAGVSRIPHAVPSHATASSSGADCALRVESYERRLDELHSVADVLAVMPALACVDLDAS